ncbi:MAG: thioredoxin-dependent thiol peroxidase [Thermogutta sp.]
MNKLSVGDKVPDFQTTDHNGQDVRLSDYRGRWVVLFFYPKDNTPICTREACSFRDAYDEFQEIGAVVLGVSADPPESHARFAEKHRLTFPLLTDDGSLSRLFGVRKLFGILPRRATFVIAPEGTVAMVFYADMFAAAHVKRAMQVIRRASG